MAGLHSLTEEALVEARNWANRSQWSAHDLLDDVLSEETLRTLKTDRLLFLESHWHLRKQTLCSPFVGGNFEAEPVFEFVRGIGDARGRSFCHSGHPAKCALDSATWISENILEIVGPPLTNWKSETVEEIEEALDELRHVIRWNPKELESQLAEECEFAIENLRDWKRESVKVRLRLLNELDSLRNESPSDKGQSAISEQWPAQRVDESRQHREQPRNSKPRLSLNKAACIALLDGAKIELNEKQTEALNLLIAKRGGYVSLSAAKIRTRDIDPWPEQLKELIESHTGGGTRLVIEKVELA